MSTLTLIIMFITIAFILAEDETSKVFQYF